VPAVPRPVKLLLAWSAAIASAFSLYFYGIAAVGLLGPDEPRYASVARQMAESGDWISPRLWGELWFEKPPLTYWLAGLGWKLGLSDNTAPRFFIVLFGVLFLLFFFRVLRREFGFEPAFYATAILATSAGWLAFGQLGVTDLPMSACFGAALLLCLRWLRTGETRELPWAGLCLGLAVLAKGLVPLVLFVPAAVFAAGFLAGRWGGELGRRAWRKIAISAGVGVIVAAPWYIICTVRFGRTFLTDFFWIHHFERFTSDALKHAQPIWFYVPVMVAGWIPWCPLLPLAFRKELRSDRRTLFLVASAGFGFVFFSAARNKLPGYLLPLFPPLAAVLGLALWRLKSANWWLAASALLLGAMNLAARLLPAALLHGLSRSDFVSAPWLETLAFGPVAIAVWFLDRAGRRTAAVVLVSLGVVGGALYLKSSVYPVLDRTVSARALWLRVQPVADRVCVENIDRNFLYGLNFYSHQPLPSCQDQPRPLHLVQEEEAIPYLRRFPQPVSAPAAARVPVR
jgi:4-amino-4-deoxy-L-arabinose transferase